MSIFLCTILGVVQGLWNDELRGTSVTSLRDSEADVRRLAAERLGFFARPDDNKVQEGLLQALTDSEPLVRRAVAMALGNIGAPGSADVLVNSLAFDEGRNVVFSSGLLRAIEQLGKDGIERLVALADSGDPRNTAKVAAAFLSLRTRAGYDALPTLLANPHLSIAERAGLLRSYANYKLDPPVSLEPVLDYLVKHPTENVEVKKAGLDAVAASGPLQGDKAQALLLALLQQNEPELRLPLVKIVEEARLVKAAPMLTRWLGDESLPPAERRAISAALRKLEDKDGKNP